jgi:hypothetical protein
MCVIILVERERESGESRVCVWVLQMRMLRRMLKGAARVLPTAEDTPSEITQRFLMSSLLPRWKQNKKETKKKKKKKKSFYK